MFKKTNRLAKTTDVKRTTMRGRSFFNPYFVIKYLQSRQPPPRFTVTVTVRVSKKAVTRNKVKRVVRETLRKNLENIRPGDYVIIIKPSVLKLTAKDLPDILLKALRNNRLLV